MVFPISLICYNCFIFMLSFVCDVIHNVSVILENNSLLSAKWNHYKLLSKYALLLILYIKPSTHQQLNSTTITLMGNRYSKFAVSINQKDKLGINSDINYARKE